MPEIRVLSVKQPWATLIVRGVKQFEVRSWPPRWRGRIAIHASSSPIPRGAWQDLVETPEVAEALSAIGLRQYADVQALPKSAIIGAATIADAGIALDWLSGDMTDLDIALSSSWGPDILWQMLDTVAFDPITGVDGKLNLWTLSGEQAVRVQQLDAAGAAWTGEAHDDSEIKEARDQEIADLEYGREYVLTSVPVPADLAAALGVERLMQISKAFLQMLREVLHDAPLSFSTDWEQQVFVSGPIGQALMPGRKEAALRDVCEALAQRLTPDREVPIYLMQFLSVR